MKFSILFLYSLVFLGKHGLSIPLCQPEYSSLFSCFSSQSDAACFSCVRESILDIFPRTCDGYTGVCLTAVRCGCSDCERELEDYLGCELQNQPELTCPPLDCNFGLNYVIPFFGELPFIGPILNLLFGWFFYLFS